MEDLLYLSKSFLFKLLWQLSKKTPYLKGGPTPTPGDRCPTRPRRGRDHHDSDPRSRRDAYRGTPEPAASPGRAPDVPVEWLIAGLVCDTLERPERSRRLIIGPGARGT